MATLPPSLDGMTVFETRRQLLYFKDGTCVGCTKPDGEMDERASQLVGMAIVSWLFNGCMYGEYVSGARAVLWERTNGEMTSSIRFFSLL